MAINTFTFGGVTSSDFGIYVSGEGLFNAPKRATEVVEIPGRDGAYILDKGHFENIEVTYRVFNQEKDLADFRTKLGNLRSALASQIGYQRLTDTFHPTEYRMAAFIDGVEISPIKYNTASEFEIKFNCKPQRYLTSGETAIAVSSGSDITNPTLFPSRPLLEVEGYGGIDMQGQQISVNNILVGNVVLASSCSGNLSNSSLLIPIDTSSGAVGDSLKVNGIKLVINETYASNVTATPSCTSSKGSAIITKTAARSVAFTLSISELEFVNKTYSMEDITFSFSVTTTGEGTISNYATLRVNYQSLGGGQFYVGYNGGDLTGVTSEPLTIDSIVLDSTVSALGQPTYIDLDIGEAYNIVNGSAISVNNAVILPAELPTLKSGANTITYDNTFTSVKVVPRWWKV